MNKKLSIYRSLVYVFGQYDLRFPDVVKPIWESLQKTGIDIIPDDIFVQRIFERILFEREGSISEIVQEILHRKLENLDIDIRPEYKDEYGKLNKAYWCSEGKIYDRVIDLLRPGYWSDKEGHKVELVGGV